MRPFSWELCCDFRDDLRFDQMALALPSLRSCRIIFLLTKIQISLFPCFFVLLTFDAFIYLLKVNSNRCQGLAHLSNSHVMDQQSRQEAGPNSNQQNGKKIATIMMALCTIVATALPAIAAHFDASESAYSWVASSYLLTSTAISPVWGRASDIWSRRLMVLLATLIFLIGSLICGLAKGISTILVGRAIQGAGSGGISILANICVSDMTSPRDRGIYFGIVGAVRAIASALGPVIGGALTSGVTWRWCFYLNLPTGGVALIVLFFLLHIDSNKTPLMEGLKAIDWLGTIFLTGGTITFVLGLQFGGIDYPWSSPMIICLLTFGLVIWGMALLIEWKVATFPVMPLVVFGSRHNASALFICFSHSAVFFAGSYYLPLYFQAVLLATPLWSGVYLLPMVLSLAISSIGTGFIIKGTGRYREIIIAGLVLFTLGYGLFIDLGPDISWPRIIIYQLISGFGTGPLAQAPLVALQANIPPADMAAATATFGFIRQLSAALSVVLGAVIFQNLWSKNIPYMTKILGHEKTSFLEHPVAGIQKIIPDLADDEKPIVLQAFAFSLSRVWIFYSVLAGCGLLSSMWLRSIVLSKAHKAADVELDEQKPAPQEEPSSAKRV
ncbi:unnamed protein product [Penicillium salamii]|nr:unnamed protein product [Penicillium salamii]CAG8404726.1 unnamed protein product [Penicillium salamii]